MKKTLLVSSIVALLSITASAKGNGGNHGSHGFGNQNSQMVSSSQLMEQATELTQEQKDGLLFMVEEEKLARDVYLYLNELWGDSIFEKIAQSEQKHFDAMKSLVESYGLEAPTTLDTKGEFENEELQALYNSLIEKGKQSLVDALEVGVTIEETDITDLENRLNGEIPANIQKSYQNLLRASYNHLKAFNRQLGR